MFKNKCRVCLKQSSKLMSLYSADEHDDETPREMLSKLTGINLENEEELSDLPKQICKNCICELNLAYQFRQKALEAQAEIDTYCKTNDIERTKVNLDDTVDEVTQIKQEELTNIGVPKNSTAEVESFQPEEEHFDEDNVSPNCTDQYAENCSKTAEIAKPPKRKYVKRIMNSTNKKSTTEPSNVDYQAPEAGNILSKRGRKPKFPAEEETAFICDICGNMFSKRSRLTEHRHRHETELRYSCELCGEKFLIRETLRRHMFQHVGEKPYKCSFCSRTFFYESVKKSHELVHAGIKPYKCEQCEKAFAYPHALKKHTLIHADIKLYHCNYCDKDFRLQHHLKQHEQTIIHQNAIKVAEKLAQNKP